jgi:hypothetical protein
VAVSITAQNKKDEEKAGKSPSKPDSS